ncbi:MAG: hypothetical protein JXL81_05190 [Deltaproteobacteria bacterium]|nr:hypothetical protein [Deltaproteobacteria bacterium]
MRAITKLFGLFFISLLVTACATTPFKVAEKYDLDNELQQATEIISYRIDGWESVDNQSLIIQTNVNDYYLVVLDRPATSLPFSESIGITLTADRVKPGYENIIVADSYGVESYIIHRLYRLKDRDQATEIKKRIRGN